MFDVRISTSNSSARRSHSVHYISLNQIRDNNYYRVAAFFYPTFFIQKLLNAVFQFMSKHVNYCCHTKILDNTSNLSNCLLLIQYTSDHLTPSYLTWNIPSMLFDFSIIWPFSILFYHQLNIYFLIDAYFGVFTVGEVAEPFVIKLMATTLFCLVSSNHWALYTVLSKCRWPYFVLRHHKSHLIAGTAAILFWAKLPPINDVIFEVPYNIARSVVICNLL